MNPERPASDHEMLCEIWEATRKMMAALDEVCYRTAISSREEQEAHDQKVRAEMLEEAAKVMCWMCACGTKTHLDACGNTIHEESSGWLRCFAQGIRSLAAPAASKPEAKVKL